MNEIISVGSYKLDESGEPSSTIITSNNWPAMIDKAGLRGKWLELALIPINQLGGDWSMLEATQDSLREHSDLLKQREYELADLRAEVEALKAKLVEWAGEAYDDVGSWAAYAAQYFHNKHGLSDDLDKWAARKSGNSIDADRLRDGGA